MLAQLDAPSAAPPVCTPRSTARITEDFKRLVRVISAGMGLPFGVARVEAAAGDVMPRVVFAGGRVLVSTLAIQDGALGHRFQVTECAFLHGAEREPANCSAPALHDSAQDALVDALTRYYNAEVRTVFAAEARDW